MKRVTFICFYLLFTWVSLTAQVGFPSGTHYLPRDYGAGSQNWQIRKDTNGIVWVANNSGMISFDGYRFELYQNENKTIVRSFDFGTNDTIWVGATSEIGFLSKNKQGFYSYSKIQTTTDSTIKFSDVWKTYASDHEVLFFTLEGYIRYSAGKVSMFKTTPYSMALDWDGTLFHHNKIGLSIVEHQQLKRILEPSVFEDYTIIKLIPKSDSLAYIFSYKYGISLLKKGKNGSYSHQLLKTAPLPEHAIYDVIPYKNDEFLMATLDAGILHFHIDKGVIRSYSKTNSIQNNTISNIYLDKDVLWYASDNGFGTVEVHSAVGLFSEKHGLEGRLETILLENNQILVGGIGGLFRFEKQKDAFSPIQNTTFPIQVWDMVLFKNKVVVASNIGLVQVKGSSYESIYSDYYVRSLAQFGSDLILGLGGALQIIHEKEGDYSKGKLFTEGFSADILSIKALSNQLVFIVDANKNVFRIEFSKNHEEILSFKKLGKEHNWKENSTLEIHLQKNRIFALNQDGFYVWDESNSLFEPKWKEGGKSKAFFTNDSWVFLDTLARTDKYLKFYTHEGAQKIYLDAFEVVPNVQVNQYAFQDSVLYLTTNDGLFTLRLDKPINIESPKLNVTAIQGVDFGISLGFRAKENETDFEIPYLSDNSSLSFLLSSSHYTYLLKNKYQFSLNKRDDQSVKWSPQSTNSELSFSNISWGSYDLHLSTSDAFNKKSEAKIIRFTVIKPWYVTIYGISLWFILLFVFVAVIVAWRSKVIREKEIKKAEIKLEQERQKAAIKEAEYKAEVAEKESIRKTNELEEAREIQQKFLPQTLPKSPYLDFAAMQRTASEVGGDYYDFFDRGEHIWVAAVGDATGHGVGAGLMVSATKASLLTIRDKDLSKIGTHLNQVLKIVNQNKRLYMALLLLEFLPQKDGTVRLEVCGGGMPPIIILRKNGTVEELMLEGLPFGVMSLTEYPPKSITLYPNDSIVVYSDGLPERPNIVNEQLGYEDMMLLFEQINKENLASNFKFTASDIIKIIEQRSDKLAQNEPLDDDLTMVVVKIKQVE